MTARYTRELLEEAARETTNTNDAVRWCGGAPTPGSRSYLRRKMAEAGVDISHFVDTSVRHTEEILRELVARSKSMAEVVRRLGISPVGGNQAHISRRVAKLGIDTSHFPRTSPRRPKGARGNPLTLGSSSDGRIPGQRSRPARTNRGHGDQSRRRPAPPRCAAGQQIAARTALLRRALDDIEVPRRCARCGTGETWRGNRLVLEIDHINGDRLDNRLENLRYSCPSCHSQTGTFSNRHRVAQ